MIAAELDLPVRGLFLMKALNPLPCCGLMVEPDQFLAKYDELRTGRAQVSLPEGSISCIPWLTRDHIERVILVTFVCSERGGSGNVALGLKVMNGTLQTVITLQPFAVPDGAGDVKIGSLRFVPCAGMQ